MAELDDVIKTIEEIGISALRRRLETNQLKNARMKAKTKQQQQQQQQQSFWHLELRCQKNHHRIQERIASAFRRTIRRRSAA